MIDHSLIFRVQQQLRFMAHHFCEFVLPEDDIEAKLKNLDALRSDDTGLFMPFCLLDAQALALTIIVRMGERSGHPLSQVIYQTPKACVREFVGGVYAVCRGRTDEMVSTAMSEADAIELAENFIDPLEVERAARWEKEARRQERQAKARHDRQVRISKMSPFIQGYLHAAISDFSEYHQFEFTVLDFTDYAIANLATGCEMFQEDAKSYLEQYYRVYDERQAGEDFWRSRNHNLKGFFGRFELGDELRTDLALIASQRGSCYLQFRNGNVKIHTNSRY